MSIPNSSENKSRVVNRAFLAGRVNAVRKADDSSVFTEVTLPAPDQFTPPAIVEIRSRKRIGQVGETVEVQVACAGYRGKAFQYLDKETGERFTRRPVVNSYLLLED